MEDFRKRMHEMQALSHDLHSSTLEYLGVVAGISSWCREFAERNKMEIDFRGEVLSPVPVELGLTLLRGAPEAMFNAMKYSGVRRAEVQVLERGSEIQLVVRDAGRGFDVKEAGGKGLGLTSMRERVRLVNGRITIDSRTMGGTRVEVHLPLTSMPNSHRAAV